MSTPDPAASRDRYVDLLRVVGVGIVVAGHWAVLDVSWEGDVIRRVNALSAIPAIRPATWMMQVMPVLFFVGGFSNYRAFAGRQGSAAAFLRDRMLRLMVPTAVFIGVWLALGMVHAAIEPGEPDLLWEAARVAALPFWFLGIYVVVVGLAPFTVRLHHRWGWAVPATLAAAALVVDAVSRALEMAELGALNYVFVWVLVHQIGYFYAGGRLADWSRRRALAWAGAGLAGMVALVTWFGYPVSMVEVPGQAAANTAPPSIALVFLTMWLLGLVLLLRRPGNRLLCRDRVRRAVDGANRRVLTAYLWHVTAMSAAVVLLYPLGFPQAGIGTPGWWLLRPVWVLAVLPLLAVLVTGFGRFEVHPRRGVDLPPLSMAGAVAAGFGVFSLAVGLLGFGVTGFTAIADPGGRALLMFTFNPLQNALHLAVGGALVWAALGGGRRAAPVTVLGAALYLLAARVEWGEAETALGMNHATAVVHLVVGALVVGAVSSSALVAALKARSRSRPG